LSNSDKRRDVLDHYLAKAVEFDSLAKAAPGPALRKRYAELAAHYWRLAGELAQEDRAAE
jgi:hypothetical protein